MPLDGENTLDFTQDYDDGTIMTMSPFRKPFNSKYAQRSQSMSPKKQLQFNFQKNNSYQKSSKMP